MGIKRWNLSTNGNYHHVWRNYTQWAGMSTGSAPYKGGILDYHGYSQSFNSPRDSKGRLILRSHPFLLRKTRLVGLPHGKFAKTSLYKCHPADITWWSERTDWSSSIRKIYFPRRSHVNSVAQYKAITAFYGDVAEAKINLALAFKERQKTIDLVANNAVMIANSLRKLYRGDFVGAAKALRINKRKSRFTEISNRWLELQYGWKPLYNDIYGAMIATVPRPIVVPIRVSRLEESKVSRTQGVFVSDTDISHTVTIKCFADVSDAAVVQSNELGLLNPAMVAWELVPFSFVVDWFLPIGSWIEAQSALLGINLRDFNMTSTIKYHGKVRSLPDEGRNGCYGYHLYTTSSFRTEAEGFYVDKWRTTNVVPPPFPPRWKNPLSTGHALNALALLSSLTSHDLTKKKIKPYVKGVVNPGP